MQPLARVSPGTSYLVQPDPPVSPEHHPCCSRVAGAEPAVRLRLCTRSATDSLDVAVAAPATWPSPASLDASLRSSNEVGDRHAERLANWQPMIASPEAIMASDQVVRRSGSGSNLLDTCLSSSWSRSGDRAWRRPRARTSCRCGRVLEMHETVVGEGCVDAGCSHCEYRGRAPISGSGHRMGLWRWEAPGSHVHPGQERMFDGLVARSGNESSVPAPVDPAMTDRRRQAGREFCFLMAVRIGVGRSSCGQFW